MFSKVCAVIALIVHASSSTFAVPKPYTLRILQLIPQTGNVPRTGVECRQASEIVLNMVNNRSDILPDYNLEIQAVDEGADGIRSPHSALGFYRNFPTMTKVFPSPAMMAGYYTTGCKSLGPVLHHIGVTAFGISCSGEMLGDRVRNRNLYLNRVTAFKLVQGQLQLIRNIGKWTRIGIISLLGNVFDYTNGDFLFQIATQHNLTVVSYDAVLDFSDPAPILALKNSDARIIVYWGSQLGMSRQFLCLAHRFGLTGSRYVFFLNGAVLTDLSSSPEVLLPGCTKKIVLEQYKYSFGVSLLQAPLVRDMKSHLGIDAKSFEVMFDAYTNKSRKDDYAYRYQCHDATLDVVLTLDQAEKAMERSRLIITLRDFTEQPKIVGAFVNESAAQLDFIGLRIGRIKYDTKGALATDFSAFSYWGTGSLDYVGLVKQKENTSGQVNDDFYIEILKNFTWMTENGRPPDDRSEVLRHFQLISYEIFATITIFAGLITVSICCLVTKVSSSKAPEKPQRILSLVGSVLLNVSSILFALDSASVSFSVTMWNCKIVLLSFALALVTSVTFSRLNTGRSF